ncbi:MAG: hypothetical protein ACKO14_08460 [Armatimonadota bacterium]
MSSHIVAGSTRFAAASTLVFSTVAFAERWMYANLTVAGAYVVWTLLFLIVAPLAFIQLLGKSPHRRAFPVWFNIAFIAYCVLWCAGWFLSPDTLGEVVGCVAGSLALAGVLCSRGYVRKSFVVAGLALGACNLVGYFAGGFLNARIGGPIGMLAWGMLFGAGTGAGIGAILTLNTEEAPAGA